MSDSKLIDHYIIFVNCLITGKYDKCDNSHIEDTLAIISGLDAGKKPSRISLQNLEILLINIEKLTELLSKFSINDSIIYLHDPMKKIITETEKEEYIHKYLENLVSKDKEQYFTQEQIDQCEVVMTLVKKLYDNIINQRRINSSNADINY